jgi:glucose-6-phosphate isomerase
MKGFVSGEDLEKIMPEVEKAHSALIDGTGPGNEFRGWLDLPKDMSNELISEIEGTAKAIQSRSNALICIGIGGSYLGTRAAVEMLYPEFGKQKIFFAGHNLSGEHIKNLLEELRDRDIYVNVISKSGTTLEPAVAFRIIEDFLIKKYGPEGVKDRIICTTDKEKGALKTMADKKGYKTFIVPDDIGGRYSVLTPVGLLPIACAGINIRELLSGARAQREASSECDLEKNISYKYAAIRNILHRKGKSIEILSDFDYRFYFFGEWWRQLFAESEGKDSKGLFPSTCHFTTDLHSIGQLIQEGTRNILETFLFVEKENKTYIVPENQENLDGLNYLTGKDLDFINKRVHEATSEAHFEGNVPNLTIRIPERSAYYLGQLFYFFEKAVAISGYLLGVNPFNQPGVEAYKKKMFKLLGRPGA